MAAESPVCAISTVVTDHGVTGVLGPSWGTDAKGYGETLLVFLQSYVSVQNFNSENSKSVACYLNFNDWIFFILSVVGRMWVISWNLTAVLSFSFFLSFLVFLVWWKIQISAVELLSAQLCPACLTLQQQLWLLFGSRAPTQAARKKERSGGRLKRKLLLSGEQQF